MKKVKPFKFKTHKPTSHINLPPRPALQNDDEEQLMGQVNNMKASAPEERLARALDRAGIGYRFRWTVGAPRGLPGWKEVDFLVEHAGMIYPIEVDTAFTHRNKAYSDVLHDAIILKDREIRTLGEVFPKVEHADGDSELASQANAQQYVKRHFGR